MAATLAEFLPRVRAQVDAKLTTYMDAKLAEARVLSPGSIELVEGIQALTLRGGKRFRPVVLSAATACVAPDKPLEDTIAAGAALELLQSYLLIHDDWMDQDLERRGGPAVHAAFRQRHEEHLADSLAILAGDLASAYAFELVLEAPFPAARQRDAFDAFLQIQKEVFFGQHLDITANADVSKMHDLKTGSYTVRGPLILGALLADADEAAMNAFLAYGNPLGEAFQLADDLLGTFGDQGATGKPGNDLRNGKRTCLVSEAEKLLPAGQRDALDAVMSGSDRSEATLAAAGRLLIESGAKANVEARLQELLAAAHGALDAAPFSAEGVTLLKGIADRLAVRSS
ncbi:MAG: polyprenyl synthetase family protein [Myxococcota bacterium]